MTKVGYEFNDCVNGRAVNTFRDTLGRYWLAHHSWSWFRVWKGGQAPGLFALLSEEQKEKALAYRGTDSIGDYISARVFEGTHPISPERVAQLRANYERTHGKRNQA